MLVALASVQSCGVTTATLALAATWPSRQERPPVVIELDPAGGELGPRFGVPVERGIVTLAADMQRSMSGLEADTVREYACQLPCDILAVTAPIDGTEAEAALDILARHLPAVSADLDLLIDCGRLSPRLSEEIARLMAAADAVVVVTAPTLSQLLRLRARLSQLAALCHPAVLLCGDGPFDGDEVADTLKVPVVGHLPRDADAAAMFRGVSPLWRRPHRLPLLRAAAPAATALRAMAERARPDSCPVLSEMSG